MLIMMKMNEYLLILNFKNSKYKFIYYFFNLYLK